MSNKDHNNFITNTKGINTKGINTKGINTKGINIKIELPFEFGAIHFIGIGGIGMSGIAEIMHNLGYQIQGSDKSLSAITNNLAKFGIKIFKGHDKSNIQGVKAVVISSAVQDDNPELVEARKNRIPIVKRQNMLAELMRLKWNICIAGTHGKTTTTSMIASLLDRGELDPTVINGGIINAYDTNARLGTGNWMVVEADESDGTFIKLPTTIAVITNIDPEHLEFYGSFANLKDAFDRFIENTPFYGFGIVCIDHPEVQALVGRVTDRRIITYGFNQQAEIEAKNIRYEGLTSIFDIDVKLPDRERLVKNISLTMPGDYNILNALAAFTVATRLGIDDAKIRQAFSDFKGVKRRFSIIAEHNNISFVDDYAHHPVEIKSVLAAARQVAKGKVIAVMQPHRYTRLSDLFDDFSRSMNDAYIAIIAPIYTAGEEAIEGVSSQTLVEKMRSNGHREVILLEDYGKLAQLIKSLAQPDDLVICMGAGDISVRAEKLAKDYKALL